MPNVPQNKIFSLNSVFSKHAAFKYLMGNLNMFVRNTRDKCNDLMTFLLFFQTRL